MLFPKSLLLIIHIQFASAFLCGSKNSKRSLSPPSSTATATSSQRRTAVCITPECQPQHFWNGHPHFVDITSITTSYIQNESWRQYVPLVVSVTVIIDILLGSPIANLALGPMRKASLKGTTGDSVNELGGDESSRGKSLFSPLGDETRSRERVDSAAIARAAVDKARNTMELKKFLEENKTNEQQYDEMRRKIASQMNELDGG